MALWINDNGTWKEPTPYINDAGTWKETASIWVNDAGTWKEIYTAGPALGDYVEGGYYYHHDGTYAWICSPDYKEGTAQGVTNWAAGYSNDGYTDWFMPDEDVTSTSGTPDETLTLCNNKTYANISTTGWHWTGAKLGSTGWWAVNFDTCTGNYATYGYYTNVYPGYAVRKTTNI